jgi:hypothetical protein
MKKLVLILASALLLMACQPKPQQYFTSSPEIDMVKKANAAYVANDWKTMRAIYSDNARIYDNTWDSLKAITPDAFITALQTSLENYSEHSLGDDAVYEMIVTDEGEKWVHNWFLWKGKHNNGKTVEMPIHLSFRIVDSKVAFQVNMYNVLPAFLAGQAMPVAAAN